MTTAPKEINLGFTQLENQYSYRGNRKWGISFLSYCGFLGIIIFNILGIFLLIGGFTQIRPENGTNLINDPRLTIICLSIFCIIFSWVIGELLVNYLPTVWLSEAGKTISYSIFFKILIPWTELTDVIDRKRFYNSSTLVLAKRITILHRILGWYYFRVPNPCFVIGEDIENKKELISRVRSKALLNSSNYSENL